MYFGCFDDVTCLLPSVLMGGFTYGRKMSEMNERVWIAIRFCLSQLSKQNLCHLVFAFVQGKCCLWRFFDWQPNSQD